MYEHRRGDETQRGKWESRGDEERKQGECRRGEETSGLNCRRGQEEDKRKQGQQRNEENSAKEK